MDSAFAIEITLWANFVNAISTFVQTAKMEIVYVQKMDLSAPAILDSRAKLVNVNSLLPSAKTAQIMESKSVLTEVLKNAIAIRSQKTELYCGHFLEIAVKISKYTIVNRFQNITRLR